MAKVFFLGTNMAATCLLLTILVKYAYEYQKNEFFEVQTLFDDERLPNVACLSPRGAKVWYELMQSDLEEALIIEKKIHLFFAQYVVP
nr:hypothetical protein [Cytophagales bacterium]